MEEIRRHFVDDLKKEFKEEKELSLNDDSDDKEDIDAYKESKTPEWDELKKLVAGLGKYELEDIKKIMAHFKEDVDQIRAMATDTFKDIPDDDTLKMEAMSMLGKLGIDIYY